MSICDLHYVKLLLRCIATIHIHRFLRTPITTTIIQQYFNILKIKKNYGTHTLFKLDVSQCRTSTYILQWIMSFLKIIVDVHVRVILHTVMFVLHRRKKTNAISFEQFLLNLFYIFFMKRSLDYLNLINSSIQIS